MKLRKVYRFRMRPTKPQEAGLYRMAGARRFVYNWSLDRRKSYYAEHGKGILELPRGGGQFSLTPPQPPSL
jgi:transposase